MNYQEMDPLEAIVYMDSNPDVLVLDVREPFEWNKGHVEGAVHLPLGELPERLDSLEKSQTILCICAGGVRSEKAARLLLSCQFEQVINVTEGMNGWVTRGLPTTVGPSAQ